MMNIKTLSKTVIVIIAMSFSWLSYAETIWIDVRSIGEYRMDNIEGDILIPHNNIVQKVSAMYPDLNTDIRLYCRSGNRAGKAMSALQIAGYTNVSNAGGIEDTREERGLSASFK